MTQVWFRYLDMSGNERTKTKIGYNQSKGTFDLLEKNVQKVKGPGKKPRDRNQKTDLVEKQKQNKL